VYRKKSRDRLLWLLVFCLSGAGGVYLVLTNLRDNIVFFYSPSEVHHLIAKQDDSKIQRDKIRIGGIVQTGSIQQHEDGKILFTLIDYQTNKLVDYQNQYNPSDDLAGLLANSYQINIEYTGLLPALFREGQGIVAEGKLIIIDNNTIHPPSVPDLNNDINNNQDDRYNSNCHTTTKGEQEIIFIAQKLLTKHDENYLPPEVYKRLQKSEPPTMLDND
jgi:cytochrome c-type biogenesis protein CcmE